MMRLLVCLFVVASLSACAAGNSEQRRDSAADAPTVDTTAPPPDGGDGYLWPDSAADQTPAPDKTPTLDQGPTPDSKVADAAVPDSAKPDSAKPDSTPTPDLTPAADLCGPCGPGMKCGSAGCVCDPATCSGCCDHLGNCQPGTAIGLCGSGGVSCTVCTTSVACMIASCTSGTCATQKNPAATYPCPGSYGTVCGGSTGLTCLTGLVCATFVSGQSGFCTRYCTSDSNCSAGAPPSVDEGCNLLAGSQKLCGFYCAPGSCPTGLSCDFGQGLCK